MCQIGYISSEEKRFGPQSLPLSRWGTRVRNLSRMTDTICGSRTKNRKLVLNLNTHSSTQVRKSQVLLKLRVWMFVCARIPCSRKASTTPLCGTTQLIDREKKSWIKLFLWFYGTLTSANVTLNSNWFDLKCRRFHLPSRQICSIC